MLLRSLLSMALLLSCSLPSLAAPHPSHIDSREPTAVSLNPPASVVENHHATSVSKRDGDEEHWLSNAERLARDLPLNPPRRRPSRSHKAARSAPSAGPEASITSRLRLEKADGTLLGYIKSTYVNIFGEYGITSNPSEALSVSVKYDSLLTVAPAEVKIVNGGDSARPLLGFIQGFANADPEQDIGPGLFNYLYFGGIAEPGTPRGSPGSESISNSFTEETGIMRHSQSNIWTIDRTENRLIPAWINSSLNSISPEIYYNPSDPFLLGLGDLEAMKATMGGTYEGPILLRKSELVPSPEVYQEVVDYLNDEQYFGHTKRILEHLDGSLVPQATLDTADRDAFKRIELARQSVYSCVPFFRALRWAPHQSIEIQAYIERCIEMLLGSWGGVIAWMAYLVAHSPRTQATDTKKVLQDCTDALVAMLANTEESTAKQAIVSMPGTADLIYVLVCQIDRSSGKYQILRIYDHPQAHCALTELLKHSLESTAGWDTMETRLRSVSRGTTKKIAEALGGRALQMAEEVTARTMLGYVLSFRFLTEAINRLSSHQDLWDVFYERLVFSRCASAFCSITEKAHSAPALDQICWGEIETSIYHLTHACVLFAPHPTKALPSLVEEGFFHAALACLPHVDPHTSTLKGKSTGAVASLEVIIPYFYVNKVYWAAANRGDLLDFGGLDSFYKPPSNINGAKAMRIWRLFAVELERARLAHQGRVGIPINMCSNIKHEERHSHFEDLPIKTCNGCQWVTYCSKECQGEDWTNFHSRECHITADRARKFHLTSSKHLLDLRRSQILYLESHVNQYGLTQILDRSKAPPTRAQGDPTPILIQNFSILNLQESPQGPGVVPQYTEAWDSGFEMAGRVAQFVQDAQANPDKISLMEGNFQLTDEVAVRTLVKLEYDPGKENGHPETRKTRYRVVGSLFRPMPSVVSLEEYMAGNLRPNPEDIVWMTP